MNKYIDADKLTKAIEEKGLDCSFALKMERLDTLALIDELKKEQQDVDLEKEIDRFWDSCIKHKNERGGNVIWSNKIEIEVLARHFAEWGAVHRNARRRNINESTR